MLSLVYEELNPEEFLQYSAIRITVLVFPALLTLSLVVTDPFSMELIFYCLIIKRYIYICICIFRYSREVVKLRNPKFCFLAPSCSNQKLKLQNGELKEKKKVLFSYFCFMERELSSVKLTSQWLFIVLSLSAPVKQY